MLPDGFWTYTELSALSVQALVVFLAVRALKYGPVTRYVATPTLAYIAGALVQIGWLWGTGTLDAHALPLAFINALLSAAVAGKVDDLGDPAGRTQVTKWLPAMTETTSATHVLSATVTAPSPADSAPNTPASPAPEQPAPAETAAS